MYQLNAAAIYRNLAEVPLGATALVLQRHASYRKTPENGDLGSLTDTGASEASSIASMAMQTLMRSVFPSERRKIALQVVASPTDSFLGSRGVVAGPGRRAIETAQLVLDVAVDPRQPSQPPIPQENIIGYRHGQPLEPIIESMIEGWRSLERHSAYVELLIRQHMTPDGTIDEPALWQTFEMERDLERQKEMGIETSRAMGDRLLAYVREVVGYSQHFHHEHPGWRLLVWAVTGGELIAPFAKNHVFPLTQRDHLPVEAGGGLVLLIHGDAVSAKYFGRNHPLNLDGD